MRGAARDFLFQDCEYSSQIAEHLVIPKTGYLYALLFQTGCSALVVKPVVHLVMLPAIQFYGQFQVFAIEVNDIRWNRMLPPELQV